MPATPLAATARIVQVELTLAEAEALTLFLAEKEALWVAHAEAMGVPDPMDLPGAVAQAHAVAVKALAYEDFNHGAHGEHGDGEGSKAA